MKRLLLILGVLVIVASGVWFFFGRMTKTDPVATTTTPFRSFFPLGNETTPDGALDGQLQNTPNSTIGTTPSRFKQLSARAVAGYTSFDQTKTITTPSSDPKTKPTTQSISSHIIRYISRANGFVYELTNGSAPVQVSNIFIPNIYEGVFADNGKTAIVRFLRDDKQTIATYSIPIPEPNPDNTRTQKQGVYFPDNSTSIALSPLSTLVARVTTEQGTAVITTSTSANLSKKVVLRNPFREWLLLWQNKSGIYVQTKASARIPGYLYLITPSQKLQKVLGTIPGLTTSVSPSGTYMLYSQSTPDGFVTKLFNTKTTKTTSISLALLPEKCTWTNTEDLICAGNTSPQSGIYPDAWYAGIMHFEDHLYRIYTGANTYDELYNGTVATFDMTNLSFDETKGIVYFIDKQTGVLWQYSL